MTVWRAALSVMIATKVVSLSAFNLGLTASSRGLSRAFSSSKSPSPFIPIVSSSSSTSSSYFGFAFSLFDKAAGTETEVDPGKVEGTDLTLLNYPHPALRNENSLVTDEELSDGTIGKLAKEMFLIMYASNGVGLAAPQVGVNKR